MWIVGLNDDKFTKMVIVFVVEVALQETVMYQGSFCYVHMTGYMWVCWANIVGYFVIGCLLRIARYNFIIKIK